MRPFQYLRQDSAHDAVRAGHWTPEDADRPSVTVPAQYLAGGTTLVDLMRLDVMQPHTVIDINPMAAAGLDVIAFDNRQGLRLGGLARMSDAADHPAVRENYPMIAQSLNLAASAQIRNMATLAGNVLQRTRCTYFRDVSYASCNKRNPGSGCAALDGINRRHAVLGVSDNCIAAYAGDFAQALIALDATVDISGPNGDRTIGFAKLHRPPGETPEIETSLAPGELITGFTVPAASWIRRSMYLKVRDRQSYEFALASAAVALEMDGGTVKQAHIALGGVSALPWRSRDAEAALNGRALDDDGLNAAAEAAFAGARPRDGNVFKIALGKRTLIRALRQTAALEL
jgi:xanthine dehydrogenase YagS FAD-binding subunit